MSGIWTFMENDIRADTLVSRLHEKGITAELIPPDWGKPRNGVRIWVSDDVAEALGVVDLKPSGGRLGTPCMEDDDG